jgi:hypothetical protein
LNGGHFTLLSNYRRPLNAGGVQFGVGSAGYPHDFFKDMFPPEKQLNKLFRFGEPTAAVSSLIVIKDRIFAKIFTDLVEFIVEEGVASSDIRMMAWLLTHCAGNNHLFANTPTDSDPMKLLHIANVKQHGRVSDVTKAITKALARYPTHFVMQCQFQTTNTLLGSVFMNKESLERIYKNVNLQRDDEL